MNLRTRVRKEHSVGRWAALLLLVAAGCEGAGPVSPLGAVAIAPTVSRELAGDWVLTVRAYFYCDDLPVPVRQRELPIHVVRSGNALTFIAAPAEDGGPTTFEAKGSVSGYDLSVELNWVDALETDRVEVKGRLAGFVDADAVSGVLAGAITVYPTAADYPYNRCTTASFAMVRQS